MVFKIAPNHLLLNSLKQELQRESLKLQHTCQSLKFYMENNKFNSDSSKERNEIASQQDRILCEVTHSNSNLSQQGLISVRSTSTWLISISDHTSIPHNNYLQTSQTVTDYKQRNYLQFKLQLGNHWEQNTWTNSVQLQNKVINVFC